MGTSSDSCNRFATGPAAQRTTVTGHKLLDLAALFEDENTVYTCRDTRMHAQAHTHTDTDGHVLIVHLHLQETDRGGRHGL